MGFRNMQEKLEKSIVQPARQEEILFSVKLYQDINYLLILIGMQNSIQGVCF